MSDAQLFTLGGIIYGICLLGIFLHYRNILKEQNKIEDELKFTK